MNDNTPNPLAPIKENHALGLRKEARLPAHLPSISIVKDISIYTTIINLSAEGIGLLSAQPFEAGQTIEVSFEYKGNQEMVPVTLQVDIKYCNQLNDEYYIGGNISGTPMEYTRFFKSTRH